MNDARELDLLIDLVRLLKKYGPDTFEKLSTLITSPDFSVKFEQILGETAKASRKMESKTKRQSSQRDFRMELLKLEQEEAEKGNLLLQFYDGILAKKFLPSLKDVEEFLVEAGLPAQKQSSRAKCVVPLVQNLMGFTVDEIKEKLSIIEPVLTPDDRSLESWANIIMKKK